MSFINWYDRVLLLENMFNTIHKVVDNSRNMSKQIEIPIRRLTWDILFGWAGWQSYFAVAWGHRGYLKSFQREKQSTTFLVDATLVSSSSPNWPGVDGFTFPIAGAQPVRPREIPEDSSGDLIGVCGCVINDYGMRCFTVLPPLTKKQQWSPRWWFGWFWIWPCRWTTDWLWGWSPFGTNGMPRHCFFGAAYPPSTPPRKSMIESSYHVCHPEAIKYHLRLVTP